MFIVKNKFITFFTNCVTLKQFFDNFSTKPTTEHDYTENNNIRFHSFIYFLKTYQIFQ